MAIRLQRPVDHPQRLRLHNEVHSRPPEAIVAPARLSYLALLSPAAQRDEEWQRVCKLARQFDVAPPSANVSHYSEDFGPFRLTWERHTEFARYTFIVAGANPDDPFSDPAIAAVPADWVTALPGDLLVATHVAVLGVGVAMTPEEIATRWFGGNVLIGSAVGAGAGRAYSDFRIQDDGFSRLLLQIHDMTPRQCGRMVQRLLEIDTYRMLALLALPVALENGPIQTQHEQELAEITQALAAPGDKDEQGLLERLTQLDAKIESRGSASYYRFSAAEAYYDLVERRIDDLREERLEGLQTFRALIERRLAPAMATCRSTAARQAALSDRVAHTTQLLSTRVDLTREQQNQAVLESMNRRAGLQLRLQSTVEGLSVAAITYYLTGLVGYAAKALKAAGVPINIDIVIGASIPVIALLAALGIHHIRKSVTKPKT